MPAPAAAVFVERAERIAESLEAGVALAQGRDLGRAGGFRMPEVGTVKLEATGTGFAIDADDLGTLFDLPTSRCGR